jgi:hypothetical protein
MATRKVRVCRHTVHVLFGLRYIYPARMIVIDLGIGLRMDKARTRLSTATRRPACGQNFSSDALLQAQRRYSPQQSDSGARGASATGAGGARLIQRWPCLLLALLLAACAQTSHHRADGLAEASGLGRGAEILIVEPDIELTELFGAGVQQPRADWTAAARQNVDQALELAMRNRQAQLRRYHSPQDAELEARQRQAILLHEAVGMSILLHRHFNVQLPSKGDHFDWTLGPGVRTLDPTARYALFLFIRDSYASDGRKALAAFGMLLGIGVQLGQQLGFASLVDLDDGRVVWFNLLNSQTGDLRDADSARAAVAQLLDGVPL